MPLVLLHGFGGTHRVWDGVVHALGGGARVLAYDLPGHGGSLDFPDAGLATVAARAVLADLQTRGITRFHLAGHSFGGATAALMALKAPGEVASLTLLAPGGFGPEINGPLLRRLAEADGARAVGDCLAGMAGPDSRIAADAVHQAARMRAVPGQRAVLERIHGLMVRDGRQGVIPRERLAGLEMPVHVAWGTLDPVLPARQAEDLPPHFVLHSFPGLGHMLPLEAPGGMAGVVTAAMAAPYPARKQNKSG